MAKDPRFSVQALENLTKPERKAMHAEYTRLRDIAQKRIKRLGASEFSFAKAYQNYQYGFPKLRDLSEADFPKALAHLYTFVNRKSSTITGQRERMKKTIEMYAEQDITLTPENYKYVAKVMQMLRKRKLLYDSEKAVTLVETILSRPDLKFSNLIRSPKIGRMLENLDDLKAMPALDKGKYYGINQLSKMFNWE